MVPQSELAFVEGLLLAQADLYLRNRRGSTPLDLATDEDIRRLLDQTAFRAGTDPEEVKVKDVVTAFLNAAREGNAEQMKALVVPSLREKLPDRAERAKVSWTVTGVKFGPGEATVLEGRAIGGPTGQGRPDEPRRAAARQGCGQTEQPLNGRA
jgi:hypothetical protein